jgi:hypothetical protein
MGARGDFPFPYHIQNSIRHWLLTPVILATWEAETGSQFKTRLGK